MAAHLATLLAEAWRRVEPKARVTPDPQPRPEPNEQSAAEASFERQRQSDPGPAPDAQRTPAGTEGPPAGELDTPEPLPPCRRVLRWPTPNDEGCLWLFCEQEPDPRWCRALCEVLDDRAGRALGARWGVPDGEPPDGCTTFRFLVRTAGAATLRLALGLDAACAERLLPLLEAAPPRPAAADGPTGGLDLRQVEVELEVYVGGTRCSLARLAAVGPGSILALDARAGDPAYVAIHGRVVAWGEVVVLADDTLGVRIQRLDLGARPSLPAPTWLQRPRAQ